MLKNITTLSCLTLLTYSAISQIPCINGMSGGYPCENVEMLSFLDGENIGGGDMNDIWGWVDPEDGTEYAIIGRTNGTAFIDISDPLNPIYIANLPTATSSSMWRDIKVYNNHAFIVAEAGGHGMQIVDLTLLSDITSPPQIIESNALYTGWGNAHNIVITESTARAYGVGTNTFEGGLHILDISNPLEPLLVGGFSNDGYTHDAQVVSYTGPDTNYQGKEIAFCCNENTVTVVDVTDPTDVVLISSTSYSGVNYTHQGWLTEDQAYFISNDELDEQELGVNTTSFIWDMSDLSAPQIIGTFVAETTAIDHNLYLNDGLVYQSNYRAGLRILDTENIISGELEEVGYFDVYPSSDAPQFNGTWSNFPYFPSGVIAVSHIEEGLFLLRLAGELSNLGCMDTEACNYDPTALEDDGSCVGFNECGGCEGDELFCVGCTNENACNYNIEATIDDGSCFELAPPLYQAIIQENEAVIFTNDPASFWYETFTSPEELHIGETYTMPFENFSQSIWVANSNGEYDIVGGKEEPDFNNGQFHDNNAYWLVFDVFEDVIFESVEVYSQQSGAHVIEILDSEGNLVEAFTQFLSEGFNVFNLNCFLPAGDNYEIKSGSNEPLLWRDDSGANVNFPYEIGSLASVISTTISSENQYNYYYFYYNWRMSSANPCLSPRTEFEVIVHNLEEIIAGDNSNRKVLKIFDITGREITSAINQLVFVLYQDGTIEKIFVTDHF